ncbi:MAG: hypothetical protein LBN05_05720 [Oscillospiraceae bacterium]|jgi:uncharacterized protein (TIGR02145 family)|nr:hypothetical protein [Oscillospiraceae bacterium]
MLHISKKIMVGSLLTVLTATTLANLGSSLTFAATTTSRQEVHTEVLEECTFETGSAGDISMSVSGSTKTAADTSTKLVVTSNAAGGWQVFAEVTGAVTDLTIDGGATGTGFASSLTAANRWNMSYTGTNAILTTPTALGNTAVTVAESTNPAASEQITIHAATQTDGSIDVGDYFNTVLYTLICQGGTTQPPAPMYMQDMTSSYCAGMNIGDILTLEDTRDSLDYTVGKLADGKCWMLDNLKLGSTSGTLLLTSDNTDLNSTTNPNITNNGGVLEFTLPQLVISASFYFDDPYVYGPVTGDTGTGATNYGYLYNWSAATAGESRTTMPANSGDAANSICPAGWHLPSGDGTGDYAVLNASMQAGTLSPADTNSGYYANWLNDGPFRGVFSGNWVGGYGANGQGTSADLWSRSAYPSGSSFASSANLGSDGVYPSFFGDRSNGFGVRCLLNN